MPVILALALALTAAILNIRMTLSTQVFLDQVEAHIQSDHGSSDAGLHLQKALEKLSLSTNEAVVLDIRTEGFQVDSAGLFFNPLLWLGWGEEQRDRFARSLRRDPAAVGWLDHLQALAACLPEKPTDRPLAFDRCTERPLLEDMALFPELTALNLNEAPLNRLQMMMPELSTTAWMSVERERRRLPFVSMQEMNERIPEVSQVSPLSGSLDVRNRYLWIRWKGATTTVVWLVDRQGAAGPRILFTRDG